MKIEAHGLYLKVTRRFFRLDSALADPALAPGPSMPEIRRQIMRKLSRELGKRAETGISPERAVKLDVLNDHTPGEIEAAGRGPA
jgi:hypothetical protein